MPIGIYKHKKNQGFQKGHKDFVPEKSRKIAGEKIGVQSAKWMLGKKMTLETKVKMSLSSINKKKTLKHRKNISSAKKGEKSNFWKGGVTPINKAIRNSFEYKSWRETVFKRDNWTCVLCKIRGGNLEADHIKPFAYFHELRFNIDNGRTLCVSCHKKTDTYGRKLEKIEYYKNKCG